MTFRRASSFALANADGSWLDAVWLANASANASRLCASNNGDAPRLSQTMIGSPTGRIQNSPKRLFRDRVRTEFLNGPPALNGGDYRRVRND